VGLSGSPPTALRWTSATAGNGDLERLARLRTILPLIATDLASARRRASALEIENRRLSRRVAELESRQTDDGEPNAAG
jgi:hypothetical protein